MGFGVWRRTTLLLYFCISLMAGLVLGFYRAAFHGWWLVLVLFSVAVLTRWRVVILMFVVLSGLLLGWGRGADVKHQLAGYHDIIGHKTVLQVTSNEDAVYGKHTQLTFVATHIIDDTGHALPGKISVSGFGANAVMQNDTVIVQGTLRPGIGGYEGFMSYAQLTVIKQHPSAIAALRRKFTAGMQNALPEPVASFSMGLLIGQRATLTDSVKTNLSRVGLTHIIAVSGYNLTIMLEASRKLLGKRSKRLSTLLTLGLMAAFVLMAGTSPSIIRAAMVSLLSIAAAYYGHKPRPLVLLAIVAALTAYSNPIYIWSDASWYLSFLAFFGILVVSPLLQNRLPRVFQKSTILAVALESVSAEIMAVPYILYVFGQMSFIGLPANMLITTLVPLGMLLGLIAGLAGMFVWPICGWFAWPAKVLLTYMLDTAQVLAGLPHIFVDKLWLSLPAVLAAYGLIVIMTSLLTFHDNRKTGIITDKNGKEIADERT